MGSFDIALSLSLSPLLSNFSMRELVRFLNYYPYSWNLRTLQDKPGSFSFLCNDPTGLCSFNTHSGLSAAHWHFLLLLTHFFYLFFLSSYLLFRLGMLALSSAVHVYYFFGNFLLFVLFVWHEMVLLNSTRWFSFDKNGTFYCCYIKAP